MANATKQLNMRRLRRKRRTRAKIFGTKEHPRLSIFRSNRLLFAQLVDDEAQKTIISGSTRLFAGKKNPKAAQAAQLGSALAVMAKEKGIHSAIADRGGYAYHGRVKALIEGMRKEGIHI